MEEFLYYIRDHLTGTHYFIYAFILLFFMFSIIGYLFKQKYAKLDIKLNTSQNNNSKNVVEEPKKEIKLSRREQKRLEKETPVVAKNNNTSKQENVVPPTMSVQATTLNPKPLPAEPVVKNPVPIPSNNEPVVPKPIQDVTPSISTVNESNLSGTIPEL